MHSIEVVLVMLLAVVASSYLVRALPFSVPLPLVQIALGVLIAILPDSVVELEPEIFLFLFLPPLLFLDGWRIPKTSLFHDKVTVISLALGLVLFTIFGAGFLIHWLVPNMPLPVAFALAAVISPTDPVAVSSIVSRCPIPKRLMHILEGESLLNDASGLVCFRFAVVALAGTFSLGEASLTFAWMAVGGLALGVAVTWATSHAQHWLSRHWGEEGGAAILVNLLIPFGAYLAAEYFHASGILAAVAAGITMSYIELSGRAPSATRVQRTAVWDMARFALNGLMFVLLGEQLPAIVSHAMEAAYKAGAEIGVDGTIITQGSVQSSIWLVICALLITVALVCLRYVWVWVSLKLMLFCAALAKARRDAGVWGSLKRMFRRRTGGETDEAEMEVVDWRIVPIMSLAGVRGAVTLAGVLSLPLVLSSKASAEAKAAFLIARPQAIFLAAMVILVSLVTASVLLPWLLRGKAMRVPDVSTDERGEEDALRQTATAAIKAVEEASHEAIAEESELYAQAALRVIETYRYRLVDEPYVVDDGQSLRNADRIELKLRQVALKAERDTITHIARTRRISDDVLRRLMDRIDALSVAHGHPKSHH